ncbi:HicB family protein [Desulfonema ishimotonii]|uniref:HicB family protein n=1 Tax=Desulfonema ishimotonii TaxID=45657 RepID=A0A401FWP6_9BACT|nr:type II toxin-antitoxin system HicB family antitoxin [Desulfonema ishimotonii]GBC61398.1 HicB family protein [Desulfonema ishimotonii]
MSYRFNTIIEKDAHGFYAFCPELEGCHTQGDTLEEVIKNMREAIALYIETLTPDELRQFSDRQLFTTTLEVNVA